MIRLVLSLAVTLALIALAAPSLSSRNETSLIANRERSVAAFRDIATVLQSPRCMNCHVMGDRPRQGDDRHLHAQNVMRGPDGKGLPGMRCSNCHQQNNHESAGGPPGAPDWQMPRASQPMAWEGLSVGDLCRAITDPKRNGNRRPADLIPHMNTSLVVWAWNPGPERTTPPLSYDQFTSQMHEWVATGAACEN